MLCLAQACHSFGMFSFGKAAEFVAQLQGSGWMFHTLELEHRAVFPLLPKARGDSLGHLGQLLCVGQHWPL